MEHLAFLIFALKSSENAGDIPKKMLHVVLLRVSLKKPIANIFYEILLTSRNDKSIMQYDNDSCQ